MAAIIDGVTHSGYWKLTADNATPTAYYVMPKSSIFFITIDATTGTIRDIPSNGGTVNIGVDSSTVDHNGDPLNTVEKIANYLELYR